MKTIAVFFALLLLSCGTVGPARMLYWEETMAPSGFQAYCARDNNYINREECGGGWKNRKVGAKVRGFEDLEEVNSLINRRVRPGTDPNLYGAEDYWAIAVTEGDCEDYALAKLDELLKRGWPISALSFATAKTWLGNGHVVLVVSMPDGEYLLDNLFAIPVPWWLPNYTWEKRQFAGSRVWARIAKPIETNR